RLLCRLKLGARSESHQGRHHVRPQQSRDLPERPPGALAGFDRKVRGQDRRRDGRANALGPLRHLREKSGPGRAHALRPRRRFHGRHQRLGMGTVLPRRRRAGQGHGQHHGQSHELRRPPRPSLRPRLPRRALSQGPPRVLVAGALAARHESRAVDGVQGGGARRAVVLAVRTVGGAARRPWVIRSPVLEKAMEYNEKRAWRKTTLSGEMAGFTLRRPECRWIRLSTSSATALPPRPSGRRFPPLRWSKYTAPSLSTSAIRMKLMLPSAMLRRRR